MGRTPSGRRPSPPCPVLFPTRTTSPRLGWIRGETLGREKSLSLVFSFIIIVFVAAIPTPTEIDILTRRAKGKDFSVLVLHLGLLLLFLLLLMSLWVCLFLEISKLVEWIQGRDWRSRRAGSSISIGPSERWIWLWDFSSWVQIFGWYDTALVDGFRSLAWFRSANGGERCRLRWQGLDHVEALGALWGEDSFFDNVGEVSWAAGAKWGSEHARDS